METLTPIKTIQANFGKPLPLSSPSYYDFVERLRAEAKDAHDDTAEVTAKDMSFWESSLTKEQDEAYTKILEQIEAEIRDPKAAVKLTEEREKFYSENGKHICGMCSHYFYDFTRSANYGLACCEHFTNCPFVRPYELACPDFTISLTEKQIKERKDLDKVMKEHPEIEERFFSEMRLQNATRFAKLLRESPSTAFLLHKKDQDDNYVELMYTEHPLIFATTQYPSYPLFLEAYTRWLKDVEIKEDADGFSLTVSQKEFVGNGHGRAFPQP